MGRGSDHHIDVADEKGRQSGCNHKALVVQDALDEALIGRDVGPDPDDANSVHVPCLPDFVSVSVIDSAHRKVWDAGDDRHLIARLDPLTAMLEGSTRGGIYLRRKIVCQEEDMHLMPNRNQPPPQRPRTALQCIGWIRKPQILDATLMAPSARVRP